MSRELLTAWLLLLLDDRASYGYDLRRALDEHGIRHDSGTLYRVLRKLDSTGWLESRWMNPADGPRRRFYRLTAKGRRNVGEVARMMLAIRDGYSAFLDAYEAAGRGRPDRAC